MHGHAANLEKTRSQSVYRRVSELGIGEPYQFGERTVTVAVRVMPVAVSVALKV